MNRLGRYWRAQPLLSVLLLAALLTRGLIPVGYMPAAGQGFFALELCTAPQYRLPFASQALDTGGHSHPHSPWAGKQHNGGAVEGSPASDTAQEHEHGGPKTPAGHDSPCPFAVTALSAPPPAAIIHAIPADTVVVQTFREPQVGAALLISRSQSARAPPALS